MKKAFKLFFKVFPILEVFLVFVVLISVILVIVFGVIAYKKYERLPDDLKNGERIKVIEKYDRTYYLLLLRAYLNFLIRMLLSILSCLYSLFIILVIYIVDIFMNPFYNYDLYKNMTDIKILNGSIVAIIAVFLLKDFLKNFWKYCKSRIRDFDIPIPTENIDVYILQKDTVNKRLTTLKKKDKNKYFFESFLYKVDNKKNYYFATNSEKDAVAIYHYESGGLYIKQNNKIKRYDLKNHLKSIMNFSFEHSADEKNEKYQIIDLKKKLFNDNGKWLVKFNDCILIDNSLDRTQLNYLWIFVSKMQKIYCLQESNKLNNRL